MAQRYPPLSGFNSRDRSPQRFQDRRPPSGPRGSDDPIPLPLGREPPRGPKALIDPPRGGHYGGRGRGYPGRGGDFRDRDRDFRDRDRDRDRDFRDLRDGPPPFRRDMDRDWGRRDRDFDHRDSRVGFGRGRSRSPPPRDFRDVREPLVRDPDVIRMRRGSRDSLLSTSSGPPDGPPVIGHHPRSGPIRGRGRGDWDGGRGRGRPGPFMDDRDSFRRRSRSRDGWWDQRDRDRERDRDRDRERMMDLRDRERDREREREREQRDRDRDRDRERDRDLILDRRDRERERDRDIMMDRRGDRFDRRDEPDRRFERDDRDRPADFWKRDRPLATSIPSSLPPHNPPPSLPGVPVLPLSDHRPLDRPPSDRAQDRASDQPIADQVRKPSIAETRRDAADRPEFLPPRPEPLKEAPSVKRSPPPSAPQVPAFGSMAVPVAAQSYEKATSDSAPAGPPLPTRAEKERNEPPSSRPPIHPPTGPKAERAGPLQPPLELRIRRDDGSELPGRPDTSARGPKPHTAAAAPATGSKPTPDLSPPTAPAAMTASKHGGTTHPEPPIATKLGPSPTSPVLDRGPPPAATSPGSQTSPRMPYSSIPTGPRALQQRQAPPAPSRGPPKGSKQWVRPGYTHPPPLGPGAVPPTKRSSVDGKLRSSSVASEELKPEPAPSADDSDQELEAGEIAPTKEAEPLPASVESPQQIIARRPTPPPKSPPFRGPPETKPEQEDRSHAVIPDFGDEDEEDEDENIVFTQEYLAERRQIFEKDMRALEAEMPPPPLEDPSVVSLLMQIQLLGMVAYDTPDPASKPAPASAAEPTAEPAPEPERGPESEPEVAPESEPLPEPGRPMEVDEPRETDIAVDEKPGEIVNEKQAPPWEYKQDEEPPVKVVLDSVPAADAISVENLPFLNTGPPTPISDLDVSQENAANFQALRETLRQELKQRRKETAKKNAALREDYLSIYRPWRLEIWELDNENGKNNRVTPGPTPPPPPPPPPPAPLTTAEARRYKGNSELDFQNALKASEISHQEDQLRRGKVGGAEPTARPDPMKEATIPDMLEPSEAKAAVYKDTNNNIPITDALAVFGFLPPHNDFTPLEHEKFTNAFMAYPKKWGKIAEALPGRDFQQCIIHYYLTKEEIKYKAKLNKRWSRRGRAKRTSRPKSHALMADLGVVKPDYEGEEEPAPVTDTGRPRRAAAPTFGDMDAESIPNGRRGVAAKETTEQPEKPAGRRGRTGPGSRGGRRGKAAQTHPPQSQPPSQPSTPNEQTATGVAVPPPPPMPRLPKREGPEPSLEATAAEVTVPRPKEPREREQSEIPPPPPPRGRAGRMRQRDGQYVFESTEPESSSATRTPEIGGYGSMQPTSYWSVPEQRDFPLLLAHFGRDYEGISNFMKTKTTVMVKNYFQRRIDSGQKDFEDIVTESERKKARGESTGPLPTPSVPPKRRYEATPSSIVPRPLAPHTDAVESDKNKTATLTSQAVPLHARGPAERERSVPRFTPLAQATAPMPATTLLNEDPRTGRTSVAMPPRTQGPKMGFFSEDRREPPATVLPHAAGSRVQEAQIQARQPTMQAPDLTRMEPLHPQGLRSSTVDLHGSPLLTTQNLATAPPHQQSYVQSQPQPPLVSSHSRHPSLGKPPGSPVQPLQRLEPDISPIRRDSVTQRPLYPLPSQPASISQPPAPMLSPQKELSRSSSTPAEPDAPPRQVPAKRSNIMSILNDEPEEPQPRKRFAGDQPSSASAIPSTMSPTRPMYAGIQSLSQPTPSSRQEELKTPTYAQPGPSLPPSHAYTDYSSYPSVSVGSGQPSNNDWMARFDPRGQQQQQQQHQQQQQAPPPQSLNSRPPSALPAQPSYAPYTSGQSQAGPSLANLTARSPAPPSPAPLQQRPSYQSSVYAQSPSLPPSSRELPPQAPVYRQSVGSPPPRNSSLAYGSRQGPPTPIQSSASLLNMAPRQPSAAMPYGSTASTPTMTHLSLPHQPGSHQSYQQHVQTMVNGSHQQQPHRSAFGLTGGQYGHSTPPPAGAASRPPGGPPPSLSMSRSYTPPAILQPNPSGGMSYAPSGPSPVVGPVHPLHARHPAEAPPGPAGGPSHHRVYSQGSNSGPLPGQMTPQHPR